MTSSRAAQRQFVALPAGGGQQSRKIERSASGQARFAFRQPELHAPAYRTRPHLPYGGSDTALQNPWAR